MPLPPGPDTPAAFQIFRWIRTPFRWLDECHARYGDAFTMRLPLMDAGLVVLADPSAVKEVFALGPDEGHAGEANVVLKPFLGQHSLLLLDGAEHIRQRKMMMPAFHGERMHAYGRTMVDFANDAIDAFPVGRPFPVHSPMQTITLRIIVRTVFGLEQGPRFAELADALTRSLQIAAWPPLLFGFMQKDFGRFSPWGRYLRHADRGSAILRDEIRRGRAEGTEGRSDVLAMMLGARDEAGRPLGEDEIHDELVTLLVAGHETTATALAWTLRWLLLDSQLIAKLREEISGAGGDPARIAKLELLDATVKESLRLQPVIPMVGRVLKKPATIAGWDLPTGTVVAPSVYLLHRRPDLYPEPGRFRPERFETFKPTPSELIPFGGGLRKCIGAAFALYEMKMVLAALLPRIDARLASEKVAVARRAITLTPAGGLPIVVTGKRPARESARAA
jgi:cytochrome P450